MRDDLTTSRNPMLCIVRRKLWRFIPSCGERVGSVVERRGPVSRTLLEGWRWHAQGTFAAITLTQERVLLRGAIFVFVYTWKYHDSLWRRCEPCALRAVHGHMDV